LNKKVVRPISNFLQLREVVGKVISQREPNNSYSSLIIPVQLLLKPWKGSGETKGIIEKRRGTLLGWDKHVGNERL
jgi:hypothetical protein